MQNGFLFYLFAPLMQSNYALADQTKEKELNYQDWAKFCFLINHFL